MMDQNKIGFIGCGNMASSLIGGLLESGYSSEKIWACDSNASVLEQASDQFSIHTTSSLHELVDAVDVIVLAVKPPNIQEILRSLQGVFEEKKNFLIMSVAAGILLEDLLHWTGQEAAIVRTMPNTPALVGAGLSVLCANQYVSEDQRNLAESIMRAVGLALWVTSEKDMDAVTAVSGSGPAYYFYIMETMENIARSMGLDSELARLMVLQTAYGATKMAMEHTSPVTELRARVTSPGGTTEQAIKVFQDEKVDQIFNKALLAAKNRSKELSQILKG